MPSKSRIGVLICSPRAVLSELLVSWVRSFHAGRVERVELPKLALAYVRKHETAVVFADLGFAHEAVFSMVESMMRREPSIPVILMAPETPLGWVHRALQVDVAGFLGKCATLADFKRALHAAQHGQRFYSPCVARCVTDVAVGRSLVGDLTTRETRVLHLLCDGLSTKEIARRVRLEPKTVEFIRSCLLQKTETRCAAGLVRFACNERLIEVRSRGEPEISAGPGSPYHPEAN